MRMLERRIARLERALAIRRLLSRYRQAQRDLQLLETQRREDAKAVATRAVAVAPARPLTAPKPAPSPLIAAAPAEQAQPQPVMDEHAPEREPSAWPNYDPPEHMQIRPISWMPLDKRHHDEPHHPEDEEYDPFAEFEDE